MKLKKYKELLDKLITEYPQCLNFELIMSSDDEGNSYQIANFGPNLCQVHDLKTPYDLEIVGFKGDENISNKDLNAICIN